jgi:hypothetical protein
MVDDADIPIARYAPADKSWVGVAVLVAVHATCDLALLLVAKSPASRESNLQTLILCALCAMAGAQVGILAVWAALGLAPWSTRVPTALLSVPFLAVALAIAADAANNASPETLVLVVQFSIVFAPLGLLRWHGLRLANVHRKAPIAARRSQFTIRHLLLWTATAAAFLAATRLARLQFTSPFFGAELRLAPSMAVSVYAAMVMLKRGLVPAQIWIVLLIVAMPWLSSALGPFEGGEARRSAVVLGVSVSAGIVTALSFLWLRRCGLEITRVPSARE